MIEQNLRMKEQNMKLRLLNQSLSNKVEVKNQAIKHHIASIKFNFETQVNLGGGGISDPEELTTRSI